MATITSERRGTRGPEYVSPEAIFGRMLADKAELDRLAEAGKIFAAASPRYVVGAVDEFGSVVPAEGENGLYVLSPADPIWGLGSGSTLDRVDGYVVCVAGEGFPEWVYDLKEEIGHHFRPNGRRYI